MKNKCKQAIKKYFKNRYGIRIVEKIILKVLAYYLFRIDRVLILNTYT